jgi:hypothetical protein
MFTSIAPNIDFQMWTGVQPFPLHGEAKGINEAVAAFVSKNKLL